MPVLFILFICALLAVRAIPVNAEDRLQPLTCSYETRVWNVNQKRSVEVKTIRHSYLKLAPEEVDPVTGCTVCSEDQVRINIPRVPSFSVCYKVAPKVRSAMEHLVRQGAPLFSISGYRVIKSRGPVDSSGNRTIFSNHSFGSAIDINAEQNGLYKNCIQFGPECYLVRGGEWRPGVPGTLGKDGDIVVTLKSIGFQWGGEIEGKQKDFMHFSMTGY